MERIVETVCPKYRSLRQIGEGSFGVVYRVEDSRGSVFAVKCIKSGNQHELENETRTLRKLRGCPHVVQLVESNTINGVFTFKLEFASNGPLDKYLKSNPMSEKQIMELFAQACEGLKCVHDLDIIHRDIKPDNILVNASGQAVLSDFGKSRGLDHHSSVTSPNGGCLVYMAPEALVQQKHSKSEDIWAIGACLLHICVGRTVWSSPNTARNEAHAAQSSGHVRQMESVPRGIVKNVLSQLLRVEATSRPDVREVIRMLRSPDSVEAHRPSGGVFYNSSSSICGGGNLVPFHPPQPQQQIVVMQDPCGGLMLGGLMGGPPGMMMLPPSPPPGMMMLAGGGGGGGMMMAPPFMMMGGPCMGPGGMMMMPHPGMMG